MSNIILNVVKSTSRINGVSLLTPECVVFTFSRGTKHWKPEFKKHRARKYLKVDLPDMEKRKSIPKMTPEEMRSMMLENGISPPRKWAEKPVIMGSSTEVFDPYIPSENGGEKSFIQRTKDMDQAIWAKKRWDRSKSLKKIRYYDENFDTEVFLEKAMGIYKDTHYGMVNQEVDKLHGLVTEFLYPTIAEQMYRKTISWEFIKELEIPRISHICAHEMLDKSDLYAQVTVRIRSEQKLAVYDRFGRLFYGSEDQVRDVLEYVVFENPLHMMNNAWRMHHKIIPDWLPPRLAIRRTFVKNIEAQQ